MTTRHVTWGMLLAICLAVAPGPAPAGDMPGTSGEAVRDAARDRPFSGAAERDHYTLDAIIRYALKNNPRIRLAGKDVESETYGINSAKADRMPRLDLGGGFTRYAYETPLTPIVITLPLQDISLPDFRRNIWDTGVTFKLPLFRGGRLVRGVQVAQMRKAVAEDMLRMTTQDIVYNVSSVYYKIAQLEKLTVANAASVEQLQAHKKDVEVSLAAGTVPRLDLLKADVELAHAKENLLLVKNNLESSYELLKTLMGMDNMAAGVAIAYELRPSDRPCPALDESLARALALRPDFKAASRKLKISEERVRIARGKRFPDVYGAGQYGGQTGNEFAFKENWYVGVRFSVPVFDGGLIQAEIDKERVELDRAREEERSLRLTITREVRDASLGIANADERIRVTEAAIESAHESLRVEQLKYATGAGTSTGVIDARTASLRAEADHYQAIFDKETAVAYLKKATGDDWYGEEVGK